MARLLGESLTSPVTAGVTEVFNSTTTPVSGCSVTTLQSVPSITTAPHSGQSLTKPIDTVGLMRASQSISTPAATGGSRRSLFAVSPSRSANPSTVSDYFNHFVINLINFLEVIKYLKLIVQLMSKNGKAIVYIL